MGSINILVVIPTYNEAENIQALIKAIFSFAPQVEILIVDDNSLDGTATIVKKLHNSRTHLLQRSHKQGLGKAYLAGFDWALRHGYDFVVSMDADFSHRPEDLPKLLQADSKVDVVIGSRYVPGGKIVGWSASRFWNSYLANIATRWALGLKQKDVTAGFKRYSARFLRSLNFKNVISSGYAFQVEMIFNAEINHFKILELPITFVDRRVGQSKISGELARSAKIVWRLFLKRKAVAQFIKFAIVGLGNTILDWVLFSFIKIPVRNLGQNGKQLAKAGSFVIASSSSYYFNRRWTFRSNETRIARQATIFFLIAGVGLVINNGIFYLLTAKKYLNQSDFIGLVGATAIAMFWNFFANKFWTFKQ